MAAPASTLWVEMRLTPPVDQLTDHGLRAFRPLPLHMECVVPVLEQVRWMAGQMQEIRSSRRVSRGDHGPDPPRYTQQRVLEALLGADLPPAHHHRWERDRLISGGVVLHCAWNETCWAGSVLGTMGLWTVRVEGVDDVRFAEPSPWLKLAQGQRWRDLVARAYAHLARVQPPAADEVDPAALSSGPLLCRVWPAEAPDLPDQDSGRDSDPDERGQQGGSHRLSRMLRSVRRADQAGLRDVVLRRWAGIEPPPPEVPLTQTGAHPLTQHLARAALLEPPLPQHDVDLTARVVRWTRRRLCLDWTVAAGRYDLRGLEPHLPVPQVQFFTATTCNNCLRTQRWHVPAVCHQEAWAVAAVRARPARRSCWPPAPCSPSAAFDALLAGVDDHLVDLAGLRFRHVPAQVCSPGWQGWRQGSERAWGPALGRSVLVHAAPPHLGGERARCYSLLTVGGLVTLVVRVAHAHLWREEARQLGWGAADSPAGVYGFRASGPPAVALGPQSGAEAREEEEGGGGWLGPSARPDKVYWWPALPCSSPAETAFWGWNVTGARDDISRVNAAVTAQAARGAQVAPPQPAALVYVWIPHDQGRREALARLARRQQDFLYLCSWVRDEAGRHPATCLNPAACFYRGCRGKNLCASPACRPPADGLSVALLPPSPALRLEAYLGAARLLALGARLVPERLAAVTGLRDHLLFWRAVVAEMTEEGGGGAGRGRRPPPPWPAPEAPLLCPPPVDQPLGGL